VTLLVVGGDRLGNMPLALRKYGVRHIIHWAGRKARSRAVPSHVQVILIVYDFVNHGLMEDVKAQAKRRRLPIFYVRRGVADLHQALTARVGREPQQRTVAD
jgi:hypothetical protein